MRVPCGRVLLRTVFNCQRSYCSVTPTESAGSTSGTRLKIGGVTVEIKKAKRPELVPCGYARENSSQSTLQHLKWLLQKDLLKQDVFLIGVPGSSRRNLVMQYLELSNREYEYLSLTRDTTEADIKQRREIRGGTAFYVDLCAVRAALEGRVLILDGVEKAERNVLPILNNLLENREMQLDDGRFLVAPEKYDKLLKEHTSEELESWQLVRVSKDFHVIALGLPVPKFRGHTLDPPLRSRFQSRHVTSVGFQEHLSLLRALAPDISTDRLSHLMSFVYGLVAEESASVGLPQFPVDNLPVAAVIWNLNPHYSAEDVIRLLYPYKTMLKQEGQEQVENFLDEFGVKDDKNRSLPSVSIGSIEAPQDSSILSARVTWGDKSFDLKLARGKEPARPLKDKSFYVSTKSHDKFLADMLVSHAVGDFCIIGPKGSGKTTLVHRFSQLLGYDTATVMLYQDMTSRELLQQRRMLPSGDTIWQESVLVEAARTGKLAVLDGLHRVHHSALNVLQRLVHDRELELFDGTRLIGMSRFEMLMKKSAMNEAELAERNIFPIHPSFRLIGLAEPPNLQDSSQHWLTPELLTLFVYHDLRPLPADEETSIITDLVPGVSKSMERGLVEFVETLRRSQDTNLRALADSLSTRQLLRIMRRLTAYPKESLHTCIHKACLSRFLPSLTKTTLDEALRRAEITAPEKPLSGKNKTTLRCENVDGTVYIGDTSAKAHVPVNRTMVPDILFYENEQHVRVMEDMLRDFKLGEHLLLIGNQGVGKNKIADRFLQLLDRPRQYIQLHRDTTVQTLTLQSTVVNGVLVYEDSPLVKAVKHGHVLVIDEGDKAPTHVTCVLKSLVESGEMHLADGRRIVPSDYASEMLLSDKNLLRMHPDFRVIVLANRPGFPFLGNDFFGALGDLFACHAVDNPSTDSELEMLRKYGPNVPEQTLKKLVAAFGELRSLADQGLLNYPYSTRELVNIVRHVQKFPEDGLTTVVGNVFDFDAFSADAVESLVTVLRKHGIPIGVQKASDQIRLATSFPMPPFKVIGEWGVQNNEVPKVVDTHSVRLSSVVKGPSRFNPARFEIGRLDMRSDTFSEQEASWQLPIHDANICSDAAQVGGRICVASVNPVGLYVLDKSDEQHAAVVDLTAMFPTTRGSFKPRVKLASLGERGVALHEEMTNTLLLFDLNGLVWSSIDVSGNGPLQNRVNKIAKIIVSADANVNTSDKHWRMATSHVTEEGADMICLFERNGNSVKIVDLVNDTLVTHKLSEDVKLLHCWLIGKDRLLLNTESDYKLMTLGEKILLRSIDSTGDIPLLSSCGSKSVTGEQGTPLLPAIIGEDIQAPARLFAAPNYLTVLSVGFPDTVSKSSLYGVRTPTEPFAETKRPYWASEAALKFIHPDSTVALLNDPPQTIRALPVWKTPSKVLTKDTSLTHIGGFLEVSDLLNKTTAYLPVPAAKFPCYNTTWLCSLMEAQFIVAPSTNGAITVDSSGGVRLWETTGSQLNASLSAWKKMFGADEEELRVEYQRNESDADMSKLDEPKVGKFDPNNAPHVGGNTWAGGTGGYNTAGLGGIGGPFRLDSGNPVFQMPDSVKTQVPDNIRQKAREMAKRAFQQRLREIDMSEYDADAYEKFFKKIAKQSALLKVIIESLQAKGKERQWVRHQTSGDLDDGKLIEGLTGEKAIYRRRTEKEPEPGTPMQKPKRMRICADVSGSMYRFNGYDGRLQKTLEACLMVMDSLELHADKIKYDIIGHSGEEPDASFVQCDRPPKNEKERLDVLKKMLAHAQFCVSGDHTLEATKLAVEQLAKEDADERFVIVLSDANFERYGIRPKDFAKLMTLDDRVNVFAIFIGSIGEQATHLKRALPAGKAFVCKNTADIPQIMQLIFTSTLLGSGGSAQD